MGPLAWFAYRRRSKEVNQKCVDALRLLRNAAVEIRSKAIRNGQAKRYMRVVSNLNLLCGRHFEDRFRPLDLDLLIEALLRMEQAGTLEKIAKQSADPIEQSILLSCRMLFPQVKPLTPEARRRLGVIAHYLQALVAELNRAADLLPAR